MLGYSPLPPVLVQEDFNAIGRMNGGVQPPPPTAANCKNPYVDGEVPLPGSPVVQGVSGGGSRPAGSTDGRQARRRRRRRGRREVGIGVRDRWARLGSRDQSRPREAAAG